MQFRLLGLSGHHYSTLPLSHWQLQPLDYLSPPLLSPSFQYRALSLPQHLSNPLVFRLFDLSRHFYQLVLEKQIQRRFFPFELWLWPELVALCAYAPQKVHPGPIQDALSLCSHWADCKALWQLFSLYTDRMLPESRRDRFWSLNCDSDWRT